VHKSEKYVQNEHGLCEGVTIEATDDSQITKCVNVNVTTTCMN
jgi:hypothetical protein